jgi:hypothetical protein
MSAKDHTPGALSYGHVCDLLTQALAIVEADPAPGAAVAVDALSRARAWASRRRHELNTQTTDGRR